MRAKFLKHAAFTWLVIAAGLLVLVLLILFSLTKGAVQIPLSVAFDAVFNFNQNDMNHLIIYDLRMPRALTAALAGAALSAAGALMQGTTGNPLADSGLLGLNAGAAFALAVCFAFLPDAGYLGAVFCSFFGAAFGAFLVNIAASVRSKRTSPMRLVLAGAAVTALLAALSQGLALYFGVAQNIMFWTAGGASGANWVQTGVLAPWVLGGLVCACAMGSPVSVLSLGEETAKGLGLNTSMVYAASSAVVVILAGSAVAAVGSVAFVGLIFPHLAKIVVGADYRKIIPVSAVFGAVMTVLADIGSRTLNPPAEVPLGALAALAGVPFFLYLSRRRPGRRI